MLQNIVLIHNSGVSDAHLPPDLASLHEVVSQTEKTRGYLSGFPTVVNYQTFL